MGNVCEHAGYKFLPRKRRNLAVCLRVYVRAFPSLCPQRPSPSPFASVFPCAYFHIVIVQATRERSGTNPSSPRSVSLRFLPDPHLPRLPSPTPALPPDSSRLAPAHNPSRPTLSGPKVPGQLRPSPWPRPFPLLVPPLPPEIPSPPLKECALSGADRAAAPAAPLPCGGCPAELQRPSRTGCARRRRGLGLGPG